MIFGKQPATLAQLSVREIELHGQIQTLATQITIAEEAAGHALATGEPGAELGEVSRLRTELTSRDLAIDILRRSREESILANNRDNARRLREQAKQKQGELDGLNSKTAKLLDELSRLQGVRYDSSIIRMQAKSDLGVTAGCLTPKADSIAAEIRDLTSRATALDNAAVPSHGEIDLEAVIDNGDVIKAVLASPTRVPSVAVLTSWFAQCAKNARVPDAGFGTMPRRVRIVWENDVILNDESHVFCAALARPQEREISGYDVASATFRAAA